ncbi:MAG: M42 family metallopeptidase [Promethearchaeota archaeon]
MNAQEIRILQEELSSIIGVSGHEEDVAKYILKLIKKKEGLADKAWIDPLGNVLAIIEGKEEKNRILFDAHMDEVGFMISHVEDNGFLRFVLIGSWDVRILAGQCVKIRSSNGKILDGIIGSKPPHLSSQAERKKIIEVSEMYIDIGMGSIEEVQEAGIEVGSTGTLHTPFVEFPNNMVKGKAFDDRTGCNVLIQLMRILKEKKNLKETIMFNFAVQEEIGGRGAITGAYTLEPTMAIAIENTTAGDVPGMKKSEIPVYIGKGPAITVADKSIISSPMVNKRLIKNAIKVGIPYQIKKPLYGGTDAGKIHISRSGVPSTVVSVPCRYIHSPTCLLNLNDIINTVKLLEVFIENPAKK